MSAAILMSIHPKWAGFIYQGVKTIEYRKSVPVYSCYGDKEYQIWLYETMPVGMVTGYIIASAVRGNDVFDYDGHNGCLCREAYNRYFWNHEYHYGWLIKRKQELAHPAHIWELCGPKIKRPPMSWRFFEKR